jgi:rRNA-processing protein FCF1
MLFVNSSLGASGFRGSLKSLCEAGDFWYNETILFALASMHMDKPIEIKTHVFIDTMVFLHCHPIQEIDLPKFLKTISVTLVIPRIILHELDKHKNTHPYRNIRDRAASRLKAIENCLTSESKELRSGVLLQVMTARPSLDFKEHGLSRDWPDDEMIASVLSYKQEHPSDRVVLISHDVGPRLTARHLGIETIELPESCRIPPEEDPLVKENRLLKNKLARLQSSQPDLIMRLKEMSDEDEHYAFRLSRPASSENTDKTRVISKLRESFPELHPPCSKTVPLDFIMPMGDLNSIPGEEYERYNRNREQYFSEYEIYLASLESFLSQPSRTLELILEVRNIGSAPAEDIDVYAYFPDGFSLYTKKEIPGQPKEPNPPLQPRTAMQKLFYRQIVTDLRPIPGPLFDAAHLLKKDTFSLKKTSSYELRDHIDRIKHGYLFSIKPLYLIFDSYENAHHFGFEYIITAGNGPEPIKGCINIIVEKENS